MNILLCFQLIIFNKVLIRFVILAMTSQKLLTLVTEKHASCSIWLMAWRFTFQRTNSFRSSFNSMGTPTKMYFYIYIYILAREIK